MRHANPPYHDRKLDMDIMLELIKREGLEKFSMDILPLQSVSVVGALLKNTHGAPYKTGDLYKDDMKAIVDVLTHFNQAGIHIAPNAQFHFYNLLPPVESDVLLAEDEDYAKDLPQSDLMILSYLIRRGYTPMTSDYSTDLGFTNFEGNLYQPWPSREHKNLISTSPLSDEHGIWPRAARNLGVKFVAATGTDHDEVTAKDFGGSEYEGIVLAQDGHRIGASYGHELSLVARNFGNMAALTKEGSIIGEGLRNPRTIEAPRDYERDAQERNERLKQAMSDIKKAMASGNLNDARAIMEQLRGNEP